MKIIYSTLFLLCALFTNAQIINFPSSSLKYILLNTAMVSVDQGETYTDADFNNDGEVDLQEAALVTHLKISWADNITSFSGLEHFYNLEFLQISTIGLSTINLSTYTNLKILSLAGLGLTSLDLSANTALIELLVSSTYISSLNLSTNNNLELLFVDSNSNLNTLDLSNLLQLKNLHLTSNNLSTLDLSNNYNLITVAAEHNQLETINLANCSMLTALFVSYNLLTELDLSDCSALDKLYCDYNLLISLDLQDLPVTTLFHQSNPNLRYLLKKNGASFQYPNVEAGKYCPNLEYICADSTDAGWLLAYHSEYNNPIVQVNTYCSMNLGGISGTLEGQSKFSGISGDCDDINAVFSKLKFNVSGVLSNAIFMPDSSGNYNINLSQGTYTVTPTLQNPSLFSISPATATFTIAEDNLIINQDFCVDPIGVHNDVEAVFFPLEVARPGFEVAYKILYTNKGNVTTSGTINLAFESNFMNLVSSNPQMSNQVDENLSWTFATINPFETREILVTMILNTPTDPENPVNENDYLHYIVSINTNFEDINPLDNIAIFDHLVVNAMDPNDKICLEGETIYLENVGEYLHYLIRFENVGTANAVNVVVKDIIDQTKFDLSTLEFLDASHSCRTVLSNNNKAEFIFENIQLSYIDAENDGYVLFKIKTLPTLVVGDFVSNNAEIYFDYNFPIVTNNAVTTVSNNLSIKKFDHNNFKLIPNPVTDTFAIDFNINENFHKLEVFDVYGKCVRTFSRSDSYQIADLSAGLYFVKITTERNQYFKKIIKVTTF